MAKATKNDKTAQQDSWRFRCCNNLTFEVHATGRFTTAVKKLMSSISGASLIKNTPDLVVVKFPNRNGHKSNVEQTLRSA